MVRKREMMLVAAAVAATLMLGGCDRPDSSQPRAVTPSYDGGTARPVDKSADAMADRSASMATDSSAGTAAAGKSADTGATLVAAARDDAAITAKVTQSIKADAALKSLPIQVDTKDGVVTLSGMVDTPDMRLHAHEIAAATSGVARVVDNLTVKSAG
jgi:hyperosmotically inducible protein